MPLRDHFHPPLDELRHWEGFHATWPVIIVSMLRTTLPARYFAEPRVHSGSSAEIDVATFHETGKDFPSKGSNGKGNGIATAIWAPPEPTLVTFADLPAQDEFEVLVYDEKRRTRLVAAVEIVSPANKDRPENRRAFITKCAGLLRERVSVVIVDVVSTRNANLYSELIEHIGSADPSLQPEPPPLYTTASRMTKRDDRWLLESWSHGLTVGRPLPTVPLWLADDLAVPLELEESYEQSCNILGIN